MYQNENYGNKWFYAFITNMEYDNDYMTNISIETDVYQTWQFDIIFKKSFVEREHVEDDTIGKHTVPESLEHGEYIIDNLIKYDKMEELCYVIRVSEWIDSETTGQKPLATDFGGIFSAGGAYLAYTQSEVSNIIAGFTNTDSVLSVYAVPKYFINSETEGLKYKGQSTPYYDEVDINKPSSLNGYIPKNKKLLTFPYCALIISNNNGSTNTLQYELFNEIEESPNKCVFNIKGVPCVGGSIKATPLNYKVSGDKNNEDEGLMAR